MAAEKKVERGLEIDFFFQGEEAVAAVERSLREGAPYAVALIDMRMPPGIDGLETANRIRKLDSRIHLHFITAYCDHQLTAIQEIAPPVRLSSKPVEREALYREVRQALIDYSSGATR